MTIKTEARKYRTILESAIPYIFFTHSFPEKSEFRKARLEFVNPSFLDALGLSQRGSELFTEKSFEAFFRQIFAGEKTVGAYFDSLQSEGRVTNREVLLQGSSGKPLWVQANSRIIATEEGFCVQGIFVNLERVKTLEEALTKEKKTLERILSGVGDAVCIYDRDCKVIFQSERHRKLFGSSVGERCFYAPAEEEGGTPSQEGLRWLEKKTDERGTERFFEITAFPIHDEKGQVFAGINIVRDLTPQIELEARNRELAQMREILKEQVTFEKMVGRSAVIRKVFDAIDAIAPLETTVLIEGETGTGKELVARGIHKRSLRKDKPFLGVNCGAIPETLLESELFGHVKGAFTGAGSDKLGLFQAAEGGTLFLDEIAELSPALQVKLLRVLQEGEIRRVGSTQDEKVDVRILAASNQALKDLVEAGKFRQDLFYRLHVFPLLVPPLRERKEDILLIAGHFLKLYGARMKKRISHFSRQAQEALEHYSWPGNIRELSNLVERAVILAKKEVITLDDLPLPSPSSRAGEEAPQEAGPLKESLEAVSRKKILEVLAKNHGHKVKTAKELGISRATLWRRLKHHPS